MANTVTQQVKPIFETPASHIGTLVQVLADPLLIQLPENVPGKAVDNGPSIWASAAHMEDPDGALGFWL